MDEAIIIDEAEIARQLDALAASTGTWLPARAAEVIRYQAGVISRIRDIDYWEGGGEIVDWVTLGYTEDGRGVRTYNRNWAPLSTLATPSKEERDDR